jgi:hypothetical protein
MKTLSTAILAITIMTAPAYAAAMAAPQPACTMEHVVSSDGFAFLRAAPSLHAKPLARITTEAVSDCGVMPPFDDLQGIQWRWITVNLRNEPHTGWVAAKLLRADAPTPVQHNPVLADDYSEQAASDYNAANAPAAKQAQPVSRAQPEISFGRDDLAKIHAEYKANQARWDVEYKDKVLDLTLEVDSIKNSFSGSGLSVSFMENKSDWSSGVACEHVPTSSFIQAKNKGDTLHIRGVIDDHSFGSVDLKNCELSEAPEPALHHCTNGLFWDDGSGKCI